MSSKIDYVSLGILQELMRHAQEDLSVHPKKSWLFFNFCQCANTFLAIGKSSHCLHHRHVVTQYGSHGVHSHWSPCKSLPLENTNNTVLMKQTITIKIT